MSLEQILSLAAGGAFLGLAALAAARGKRSTLALPTALLCVAMFAYSSLETLGELTDEAFWEWLESSAAAMAAPLLLHLTLTFLGARRSERAWLVGAYLYFGGVAASCLLPFVLPGWRAYPGGDRWALAMLAGVAPVFGRASVLLVRHYRRSASPEERARTQVFIGTVVIGVGAPATDLMAIAGATAAPRLAAPGLLLSAILLTALTLRSRIVRGTVPLLVVSLVLIGVVGVLAQILVFHFAGTRTALLVLGTLTVTLVLLGAARAVWSAYTEVRERTAHLATLGRLSAQMAHDIRNPLAAIRGAAQYLEEERQRGGALEDQAEFLSLILEQTERLDRVVQEYRRLGRAEPERAPVDAAALVRSVADSCALAAPAGVVVEARVEAAHTAALDRELITTALENLVRNAVEAVEGDGHVTVGAGDDELRGQPALRLEVADDGPGMDARTREQAEQAFFTTKAQGSGLGLAFVRRVAEAHGGLLRIDSALGRGTTVRLVLPIAAED
ncbi:MAG TPA: ATP-binding protein [Sandaracinaceae bacterium LLY-WYZ-13_1]|nr:ATP-binding protein [Sandaracinaceae bacterium LLY-WYZ-13_1]